MGASMLTTIRDPPKAGDNGRQKLLPCGGVLVSSRSVQSLLSCLSVPTGLFPQSRMFIPERRGTMFGTNSYLVVAC